MLAGMTSKQVSEWQAYFSLEHLGEYADFRADVRTGWLTAAIFNANRGKGQRVVKPLDAMPRFEDPKPQTPQDLHSRMMTLAASRSRAKADGDT